MQRSVPTVATTLLAAVLLAAPLAAVDVPSGGSAPSDAVNAPAASDANARAEVAALQRATTVNDRDGNKIFDDLDAAYLTTPPGQRLPVVVSFVAGTDTAAGVAAASQVAPGAPVTRTFRIIPAYAGALGRDEARRVAALAQVRQIELDRPGEPELDTATEVMGADAVVEAGISGDGDGDLFAASTDDVGIAVLDTGIHPTHADVGDKILAWRDFGGGSATPRDPNGHGTHVASIAAGWGHANPAFRGVAPGASLIGLKIDGGGSTTSNAIAAYQWIVEHRDQYGIRIATISFGFGTATDGTTALERAVDQAWEAGIVCTKSNGNGGPGRSTMTVPAAARGILSIGSLLDPFGATSKFGFVLSDYSSRGPTSDGRIKPDLTAPGESVTAARAGTPGGYTTLSGTSMAAPFAAGTVALMLSAAPDLTPDEVRDILFATAQDWGESGPDNDFGHGRIQVWQAVDEAASRTDGAGIGGQPPAVPDHEVHTLETVEGVHEVTFEVRDTDWPVAATVNGDVHVYAVEVYDPDGARVLSVVSAVNTADRQHHYTFEPTTTGTYLIRVVATPTTPVVIDLSHSSAREP